MENLTAVQKTTVTKSSTDRLRVLLMKSGYAEEVVLAWSRDQLMSKYAELLTQGYDPAVMTRVVDPEVEKARLEHEKEMKQMEFEMERQRNEMRKLELAAEAEQRAAEAQQKAAEAELKKTEMMQQERLESERLAFEREKLMRETGIKTAELEIKEKAQNDEMKMIKRLSLIHI